MCLTASEVFINGVQESRRAHAKLLFFSLRPLKGTRGETIGHSPRVSPGAQTGGRRNANDSGRKTTGGGVGTANVLLH